MWGGGEVGGGKMGGEDGGEDGKGGSHPAPKLLKRSLLYIYFASCQWSNKLFFISSTGPGADGVTVEEAPKGQGIS